MGLSEWQRHGHKLASCSLGLDGQTPLGYENGMEFVSTPGVMKKFIRTPWRFQQTVQTPLKDLQRFVSIILAAADAQSSIVTIDQIVFEPENVNRFINNELVKVRYGQSIEANNGEVAKLLVACFSDWIDFLFVPTPKPFVIYADHDDYATFYANSKSGLNKAIIPLRDAGFSLVPGWTRTF